MVYCPLPLITFSLLSKAFILSFNYTGSAANQSYNYVYYIPRTRTNCGIYNIMFNGPKLWNSIGEDILNNLKTFKEKLKT